MFSRPLTNAEAQERARLLQVDLYDIQLDLTGGDSGEATFGSETLIVFTCREPGASTFAEWRSTEPTDAFLNGRSVPTLGGRIQLDQLEATNRLVVRGRGGYSTSGEGLHRAVDPADDAVYVYSMCFLHEASRVFGCFDQPDLKAVIRLTVTAPDEWTVVSNSPLVEGTAGDFLPTPKLPPYLVALAAGPYASVHGTWTDTTSQTEIPLGLYCRKSLAPHLEAEELLEITRSGLDFFTKTFGLALPFPKYDQLFAPEFNAGAMENPGLVIHMDEFVFRSVVTDDQREYRALVVLHEMAHMWFGDLVSMRWWDDLWLNESFATFCGYLATAEATRHGEAWTSFCINEKSNARAADVRPSSHPVSSAVTDTDQALLNFDAISYNKGASLMRQLAAFVGRESFFAGIHAYFVEHAWGNTDLLDLLRALERSSGRDLVAWGDAHLRSAGLSTMQPEISLDTDQRVQSLAIVQAGPTSHQRTRVASYSMAGDSLFLQSRFEIDVAGGQAIVDGFTGAAAPDLVLVNDGDLAYSNVRLDSRSLASLRSVGVNALDSSLARALVWGSLWDLVQSAELTAEGLIECAEAAIGAEPHEGVLSRIVKWADDATLRYAPAHQVVPLRARLSDACAAALSGTHAGSGHQLALVRAHATFSTTAQQLADVQARLEGAAVQEGLVLDADLRWHLLNRLVAAGARGAAAIDEEYERDTTAFGRHQAQQARAGLPDGEAKGAAWAVATAAEATTNRLVASACQGFWQPEQLDLSRPYAGRYFQELERVWRDCDADMAHVITQTLFPSILVEPQTVVLTDEHLSQPDLPGGQQRILRDQRYDLIQALRAREAAS